MKKIILNESALEQVGFAERKLQALSLYRKEHSYPFLNKQYIVNGITILLHSTAFEDRMILYGGEFPFILLTSFGASQNYNYETNNLSNNTVKLLEGELHQNFNGRLQTDDLSFATYDKSWNAGNIEINGRKYIGAFNPSEITYYIEDRTIYARIEDIVKPIVSFSSIDSLFTHFCYSSINGFCFPVARNSSLPSPHLVNSIQALQIHPQSQIVSTDFEWVPAVFTVAPRDIVPSGWYYGNYPNGVNLADGDEVKYLGCVDMRWAGGGDYDSGWAELFQGNIYFYFGIDTSGRLQGSYYDEYSVSTPSESMINIGSLISGCTPNLVQEDSGSDVKMWGFKTFSDSSGLLSLASLGAVGICISSGMNAKFLKYHGATYTVFETTRYHSYSISRNGQILAVFEGEGSSIDTVIVFDLFGTDAVEETSSSPRIPAMPFKRLNTKTITNTIAGQIIPFRESGYTPTVVDLSNISNAVNVSIPESTLYSPFVTMDIYHKGDAGLGIVIGKLRINGDIATYFEPEDNCFDSVIPVNEPRAFALEDIQPVGSWDAGGNFRGLVYGEFDSAGIFNGTEETLNPWYGKIRRKDTFSLSLTEENEVVTSGYVGELLLGSGFDSNGEPDASLAESSCDPIGLKYTASSSCGQTASYIEPAGPLFVTGDNALSVGDIYTVSGGLPPYTIEADNVTFVKTTTTSFRVTAVSNCGSSGTRRWTTVVGRDHCGQTDEMIVLLPSGTWFEISDVRQDGTGRCDDGATTFCAGASWATACGTVTSSSTGETITDYTRVLEGITYFISIRVLAGPICDSAYYASCFSLGSPQTTILTNRCSGLAVGSAWPPTCGTNPDCGPIIKVQVVRRQVFEWRCP